MASVRIPELCLICYQKLSSRELNRRKLANSEQIEEAFSIDVVFTLKTLLKVPEEVFERFVGSCGNQVPGLWISLCDGCIGSVVEAKVIYQEILELSRRFKNVQEKVVDKLKRSWIDEDKVKGRIPRKKSKMEVDYTLSVTDECRKCVNERPISDEESFLVEDVTAFSKRLCGRLSASDNFQLGIAAQTFIMLPPANQAFVSLEPAISDIIQEDIISMEEDDNQDPLSTHDPLGIPDPLSFPDLGFDQDTGLCDEQEDAADGSDVEVKEDLEMKPEASNSPENSDSEWEQDETSSVSSESEDSPEEEDSEVKTISKNLILQSGDSKNECPTCQTEFRTVQGLKYHLWRVHQLKILEPKKVHSCPEPNCTLTFTEYRDYRLHVLSHKRGEPKHKCETCGKAFFDPTGLRLHAKSIHDIIVPPKRVRSANLKCLQCPKVCPNVISIRHHMRTSHNTQYIPEPDKNFPCTWPNCRKILATQDCLLVHLSRHEKNPGFKCDHCEERFYTATERSQHRNLEHPGLPYSCTICLESFSTQSNFSRHLNHGHSDDKPKAKARDKHKPRCMDKPRDSDKPPSNVPKSKEGVQCDLCGKQYSSRFHLQIHMKFMHEKDYKIRCSICNQGMRDPTSLKRHMVQTHKVSMESDGQLPQCPVIGCRRVFTGKEGLDRHMAREHGESGTELRFQCSHCGKRFAEKCKFTQHEMLHLYGETKPFKCGICGKRFCQSELRQVSPVEHAQG